MNYYSDIETEKSLNSLKAEIAKIYRDAYSDISREASSYYAKFVERYKREYAAYLSGEGGYSDPTTAKQKFDSWYMAQVGRGERWEDLRDRLAERFAEADQIAITYINDTTPSVYALNANYEAYTIYGNTGIDFNMVDEQTVRQLMLGKTPLFRPAKLDLAKDIAWNIKKLENAVTSGILRGVPVGKLANEFQAVANMDRSTALRNARTAITTAQNAGRQASYEAASEMGIEMRKEWIATADERTRESHAELDGVQIDYNDKFPNGLMYPGDISGDPSEVYNCRCTMRGIIPRYNGSLRSSNIPNHEGTHTKESYKEWLDRKREEQMNNSKPTTSADATFRANEAKENNGD